MASKQQTAEALRIKSLFPQTIEDFDRIDEEAKAMGDLPLELQDPFKFQAIMENKELTDRLLKAKMNRLALMDKLQGMERSDKTRRLQLAITHMETGELYLKSAIDFDKEQEEMMNTVSHA